MTAHNRLREKLESNEEAIGVIAKVASPTLVEVLGDIGLDYAWIDLEHSGQSPFDSLFLEGLSRAATIGDIDLLVRLPQGNPPLLRKVLDTGVQNVVIPHVTTPEEVRETMKASRFDYDGGPGNRGFVGGCQANSWGSDMDNYLSRQDDNTLVGVVIEEAEAIDNLEEILAVPELGFVVVGHRDLTISLGHGSDTEHPDVKEAMHEIEAACAEAGIPAGRAADSPADVRDSDDVYQLFLLGYELHAVREVYSRWVDEIRGG